MKLLNITTRYFLVLTISLLFVWFLFFYFSITWIIYHDLDEYLETREAHIIYSLKKKPDILHNHFVYDQDFVLEKINRTKYTDFQIKYPEKLFYDIHKYDSTEGDNEPYRSLTSVFEYDNNCYKITVTASLIESEELLFTILADMIALFVMLILLIVVLNTFLLKKLWRPFYVNIEKMKQYRIDKDIRVELEHSKILEFEELRKSIELLIDNSHKVYITQKQFTENASHEIQTPLTVAQNKLQLLMDQPLSNASAKLVEIAVENLDKLGRLNKTLLLLSKIENNQFVEKQNVNVTELVIKTLEEIQELIEHKNISVSILRNESLFADINLQLAQILISNIIANSIHHNILNGKIQIDFSGKKLTIRNTGKEPQEDPLLMFERFKKKSNNDHSVGLGLPIVKSICLMCNFPISYTYRENLHIITIQF